MTLASTNRFNRRRSNGRMPGAVLSAAMLSLFVYLGFSVVPGQQAVTSEIYQSAYAFSFKRSSLPVFIMREDRNVVRHGVAEALPDGRLEIELFGSTSSKTDQPMEALLFESGLPALWAAVSDSSQAELLQRMQAVQEEGARTVTRLVMSDVFIADYRPRLSAIFAESLGVAWEDAHSQAAFERFLQESGPAWQRLLDSGVREILLKGLGSTLWELARANWSNALRIPFGHDVDYGPVLKEVNHLLSNPDFRKILVEFGRERLASSQMRMLIERISIGTIDALLKNPNLPLLMAEMIGDERLRNMLRPFGESAGALAASLPRLLGGLGSESSLNPLAAHVFRAYALGTESPLILYVTPDERRRIEAIEGNIAILLTRRENG